MKPMLPASGWGFRGFAADQAISPRNHGVWLRLNKIKHDSNFEGRVRNVSKHPSKPPQLTSKTLTSMEEANVTSFWMRIWQNSQRSNPITETYNKCEFYFLDWPTK
jgi:hypothetical protein